MFVGIAIDKYALQLLSTSDITVIVLSSSEKTMHFVYYSTAVALLSVASCQSLPQFIHHGRSLSNNSYISYQDIASGDVALKCVTDNVDCCNDASAGNWRDMRGGPVQEGRDGTSCLYVTRGDREISLNRNNTSGSGCIPPTTSGLWRCDIPDSSGDMQSLYIYISNSRSYGNQYICLTYAIFLLLNYRTV